MHTIQAGLFLAAPHATGRREFRQQRDVLGASWHLEFQTGGARAPLLVLLLLFLR